MFVGAVRPACLLGEDATSWHDRDPALQRATTSWVDLCVGTVRRAVFAPAVTGNSAMRQNCSCEPANGGEGPLGAWLPIVWLQTVVVGAVPSCVHDPGLDDMEIEVWNAFGVRRPNDTRASSRG